MRLRSEISKFKLLVTLPNIIQKRAKKSVLPIYPIGYDRSGQKKSVRDEELICRKAEHFSTTNDLTVHFGQCISTQKDLFVRSTAELIAYFQTIYVTRAHVT